MPRRGENIFKRKDGRWEGRYSIGRNIKGRLVYHSVYGKTYRDVKEKVKKHINDADSYNRNAHKSSFTLDFYANEWIESISDTKKYSTVVKYKNVYQKHIYPVVGEKEKEKIAYDDLKDVLKIANSKVNSKEMSFSTYNSIRSVLKQLTSYIFPRFEFDIVTNEIMTCKNRTFSPAVLSTAEQRLLETYLLNGVDVYKLGILVCLYTGLRIGEICALPTASINLEKKSISVTQTVQRIKIDNSTKKTELRVSEPKTFSSKREIPICDYLLNLLRQHMPDSKYFLGNKPYEPRTYQYKLKKYFEHISIDNKHFHTLRHTFATNCIENGMDAKCLSEILGHSDVKTTLNRYVHPSFENKIKQINSVANNCQINGHVNK